MGALNNLKSKLNDHSVERRSIVVTRSPFFGLMAKQKNDKANYTLKMAQVTEVIWEEAGKMILVLNTHDLILNTEIRGNKPEFSFLEPVSKAELRPY